MSLEIDLKPFYLNLDINVFINIVLSRENKTVDTFLTEPVTRMTDMNKIIGIFLLYF